MSTHVCVSDMQEQGDGLTHRDRGHPGLGCPPTYSHARTHTHAYTPPHAPGPLLCPLETTPCSWYRVSGHHRYWCQLSSLVRTDVVCAWESECICLEYEHSHNDFYSESRTALNVTVCMLQVIKYWLASQCLTTWVSVYSMMTTHYIFKYKFKMHVLYFSFFMLL